MDVKKKTVKFLYSMVLTVWTLLIFTPPCADTLQPPPPRTAQDSGIAEVPKIAADSFSGRIAKIYVTGNRITRADIIKMYIGLDTGLIYDSVLAATGKRRLLNTNLFSKVTILTLRKKEGTDVYVIVSELFYIIPTAGGDYIQGKYGERIVDRSGDTSLPVWYRLRLGLSIQNFRGAMETFSVQTSVWEDRALSLSWSKPFAPSPYFFGIGAGVHDYPDLIYPWRRFIVNGRVSGGRIIFDNSRIALSFIPTYSSVYPLSSNLLMGTKLKELYSALGWSTDRKDRSFDPSRGWSIYTDLLTNALATDYTRYLQLDGDLRMYHAGFFNSDKFAYRIQTALRSNDGGIYKALYIGGLNTVRGFAQDQLGIPNTSNGKVTMNNYIVVSSEYRFTLWTMPPLEAWLPSEYFCTIQNMYRWLLPGDYINMLKEFFLRFDGALFVDAGRIWHDLPNPCIEKDNGAGFGAGIRAMAPTLRRSVGFDIAWGAYPHVKRPYLDFLKGPWFELYLDMCY